MIFITLFRFDVRLKDWTDSDKCSYTPSALSLDRIFLTQYNKNRIQNHQPENSPTAFEELVAYLVYILKIKGFECEQEEKTNV